MFPKKFNYFSRKYKSPAMDFSGDMLVRFSGEVNILIGDTVWLFWMKSLFVESPGQIRSRPHTSDSPLNGGEK